MRVESQHKHALAPHPFIQHCQLSENVTPLPLLIFVIRFVSFSYQCMCTDNPLYQPFM